MSTVYAAFAESAKRSPNVAFICVPDSRNGGWREVTYGEAQQAVSARQDLYRRAGYGHGHSVAILLDKAEFVLHFLALNALGCVVVPLNPDLKAGELRHQLVHADCEAVIVTAPYLKGVEAAAKETAVAGKVATIDSLETLAGPSRPGAIIDDADGGGICSVLFTSGTTGLPKACLLSNECHLASGRWYAEMGGLLTIRKGDRFFNPTPFHHTNILVVNLTCAILTESCVIMPDRFSASRWWEDVSDTRATAIHYVGVIPGVLMKRAPEPHDRAHQVRFGFGGGVEPGLHAAFEDRFGFPLVEIWGMTETTRVFGDNFEPRQVGTRAIGKPSFDYQAIIVDEQDREVPRGAAGELLVRSGGSNPRRYFFSGYYKDAEATEASWRNGWFHTGDVAIHADDGMLHFVDRKKNIIRRGGENISAAQVEAALIEHPDIEQVAVIAVSDDVREEEVMACVVARAGVAGTRDVAESIVRFCTARIAAFKGPAYIAFRNALPMTPSHRLQRSLIFASGVDPRSAPGTFDFRELKGQLVKTGKGVTP